MNVLGQAAFPHPEKFLKIQTWILPWETIKKTLHGDFFRKGQRDSKTEDGHYKEFKLGQKRCHIWPAQDRYWPHQVSSREDSRENIAKKYTKTLTE